MTPVEALIAARREGASVNVRGGRIHLQAEHPLADETLAALREHRDSLVEMLTLESAEPLTAEPPVVEPWFPFEVRWAHERGWLKVRDCFTGAWHEVLATQCPAWWRDEAFRAKSRGGGLPLPPRSPSPGKPLP